LLTLDELELYLFVLMRLLLAFLEQLVLAALGLLLVAVRLRHDQLGPVWRARRS
jgi:hypothetical protein